MKKIIVVLGILLLSVVLALANGDHQSEIEEGKKIVESKISCDKLDDEQLEAIGDYLMELMHPGEAHEQLHNTMGGENSETLKLMHINMAKMMYCNNGEGMNNMMNMMSGGGGMMNGMMNMMGGGMMGGQTPQTNMMQEMMGNNMMGGYPLGYSYANNYWNIVWILLFVAVIFLIVWTVYKLGIKKETVSEMPINILKNRFAKGEITKKEFDDMKKEVIG